MDSSSATKKVDPGQVTATMEYQQLWERIKDLRFYDIAALAREVKGSSLGIDINRKFAESKNQPGGTKGGFTHWVLQELPRDALLAALPAYEKKSSEYYASKGKPAKPAPQAPIVVENVPLGKQAEPVPEQSAKIADILDRAYKAARNADAEMQRGLLERMRLDIEHAVAAVRPIMVTVNNAGKIDTTVLGRQHKLFEKLLKYSAIRRPNGSSLNIWLTGPAGSGKTTAAENVAKALNLPFHFTGAVNDEFKLLGFIDAQGKIICPAFRKAWEFGGVFLFDEVDGCHASAFLALNAALAGSLCDFPDGVIPKHKDCVIIAAANTWGTGATHDYIGRNKLDDSSRDRFVMLAWEYDEELEMDTSGNREWCAKVQRMRKACAPNNIKHIISPRATYDGAVMLAAGVPERDVMTDVVRKGLTDMQWAKIKAGV